MTIFMNIMILICNLMFQYCSDGIYGLDKHHLVLYSVRFIPFLIFKTALNFFQFVYAGRSAASPF